MPFTTKRKSSHKSPFKLSTESRCLCTLQNLQRPILTNLLAKIAIIYDGTADLRSWYFCVLFEASIERAMKYAMNVSN